MKVTGLGLEPGLWVPCWDFGLFFALSPNHPHPQAEHQSADLSTKPSPHPLQAQIRLPPCTGLTPPAVACVDVLCVCASAGAGRGLCPSRALRAFTRISQWP